IVGQTITEMDKAAIAQAAFEAFAKGKSLGTTIGKGTINSLLITLESGSSCIVGNDDLIIASLQGEDASSSISLIMRFMRNLLE
ncbi:MAG: hypothetical protein ACTSXU_07075, partial [Promethearchaeota archaeon]